MKNTKLLLPVAMFALLAISLAGCSRSRTVAPGVSVSEDKDTVTVNSGGTTMQGSTEGSSVALPADMPNDVPIYPGSTVTTTTSNPQMKMMMVGLETGDTTQQATDYYEKELKGQGWEINNTIKTAKGASVAAKKGDRTCSATIGERGGNKSGTTIMLMMVEKPQR